MPISFGHELPPPDARACDARMQRPDAQTRARLRTIRALEVGIARLEGEKQTSVARQEQRSRAAIRADERRAAAFLRDVLQAISRVT